MGLDIIKIKKNTNGDTRTADHVPTYNEFDVANHSHINDVRAMMNSCGKYLSQIGSEHDYTKTTDPYKSMFYRELCATIEGKMNFEDGEWAKRHYELERHHLLKRVPDDVNLFDVFEMICDCVSAGMARSGCVRPLEIDNEILVRAMNNTVDMLAEHVDLTE